MMFHALGYSVLLLLWVCCNAQNDNCGPPPGRNNEELADLSGKQTYSHNEIILYNCRPGFIKLGRIKLQCNNGNWEQLSPLGKCKKRPCGHPGDIRFGSLELTNEDEFVFGARVVYQCDSGYQMLSQTNYRDCRADGWSHDVPHCEDAARNCGRPPAIQNGDVLDTIRAFYPWGTRLQYKCQNMYRMSGSSEVRCENGLWTEPPTCIEACTVSEEDMARNHIQLKWRSVVKLYIESGNMMEFICNWGYRKDPLSPPFRVQCIEGKVAYPRCTND